MIALPACVVVVAPRLGRARCFVEPGAEVGRGDLVAVVDSNGGSAVVHAPEAGRVGGVLASHGRAVAQGEALLWLAR